MSIAISMGFGLLLIWIFWRTRGAAHSQMGSGRDPPIAGGSIGVKTPPVLGRADGKRPHESPTHRLARAKAARPRDPGNRRACVLERTARGLKAHALDIARWGNARLGAKRASEMT